MHLASSLTITVAAIYIAGHANAECEIDRLEMIKNQNITAAAITFFVECLLADALQGEEECDTQGYQKTCEDEGYDFFTYSAKIRCDDYDRQLNDVPSCLPKSCTKNETLLIQDLSDDMTPEGYTDCALDVDVEDLSAGFTRSMMVSSLALLVGGGVACLL